MDQTSTLSSFTAPILRHCVVLFVLLTTTAVVEYGDVGPAGATQMMIVALFGLIGSSIYTAFVLVRREPNMVWMPLTLFLLSSALFYGFGPLSHFFGSEGTKAYLALRLVKASPEELLRATKLSLTGILFVMLGALAMLTIGRRFLARQEPRETVSPFRIETLTAGFLVLGLLLKFGLWYPTIWGLIDITIPGFVSIFTALAALGFGLFAFVAFSRGGPIIVLFLVLWTVDFLLTTLAFAKVDLMLAAIFPIAGFFLATNRYIITLLLIAATIGVFAASQPMVTFARNSGVSELSANGYAERANVIYTYVTERPEVQESTVYYGSQRWWTRLEYTAKQSYAMALRDRGVTSNSLSQLPIVFIPRVIWPSKPELRGPGRDFYFLLTGRDHNLMSISVYGDLFWQFGWLGVILVAPLIGCCLVLMTNVLLPHLKARNFAYFPLVLIGFRFALLDPNKFVINGVLSSAAFFVIYLVAINWVTNTAVRRRQMAVQYA